jgi:hypothetical protein
MPKIIGIPLILTSVRKKKIKVKTTEVKRK